MAAHLSQAGYPINRKRVQRLMARMGLVAIYPGPNTSKPHPEYKIYASGVLSNDFFWSELDIGGDQQP